MKTPPPRARRLQRELALRLMLPLLAIFIAAGAIDVWTAQRLTDRVFDRWLLDAARSLANQVQFIDGKASLELPAAAEIILAYDEADRVHFSVEQGGRHVMGQPGIPFSGTREASYRAGRAFDASFGGRPVRVAAVDLTNGTDQATVLTAETTIKRSRTRREVLAMLVPLALLLVFAMLAVWFAVRRTLQPLEAIATRWSARSHESLQAIGADDVPRELTPFANALNDLLARMRAMLARERHLAAVVAHQLRTPLAGIRLGLARATEAPDLASTRAVLGELDQSTQRAARMVQQLLALYRLDPEARGDLAFASTDLVQLAREVGESMVERAIEKDIDFELVDPQTPVLAQVQPALLSEALGNLLDNAIAYTPEAGRVSISFTHAPPSFTVSDSGPGIPAARRAAIFERPTGTRITQTEGTGLGLSIVRDVAALHQAALSVSSGPLGGASITMRFKDLASTDCYD